MLLNQVQGRMDQIANRILVGVDNRVKDTTTHILRNVAITTPFLTGRARFNWQVKLDEAPKTSLFSENYGGPLAAATSVLRAKRAIAAYNGSRNNSLHITNNLVYIVKLNEGHSPQAEPGYVQAAIRNGVASASKKGLLDR